MLKAILIIGSIVLVALQLLHISIPPAPSNLDPKLEIDAPKEIASMLRTSCYDCHSYQTKMPWYGHVVPMALEVRSHIKEGREWLNFQEWNTYTDAKKQKIYKGIVKTIDAQMPIPMYLKMHEKAKLTPKQRETIKSWAAAKIKK